MYSIAMNDAARFLCGLLLAAVLAVGQTTQYDLFGPAPPAPASVSAQVIGEGSGGSYFYWVIAHYPRGAAQPAGPAEAVNRPITLSSSNFIRVAWPAVAGVTSYDVLRASTPAFPGSCAACAVVIGTTGVSVDDTGGALSAYTVSTGVQNVTGAWRINNRDQPSPFFEFTLNGETFLFGGDAGDKATFVVCNEADCATGVNLTNEYVFVNAIEFDFCLARAKVAPAGASLILDINLNGSSVFGATKLVIPAGSQDGSQATFSATPLRASVGSLLTIDIDQVGSSTAGETVTAVCRLNVRP